MLLTTQGLEVLKTHEGFQATPYLCPAGKRTIGYGHVILAQEHFTSLSEAEANQLLHHDLQPVIAAVHRLIISPLNEAQLNALVCFTFNVGCAALQRSTLRQCINREEHGAVAAQLRRWIWAGGRILPGLIRRREDEITLYYS
jgi:lysozyme